MKKSIEKPELLRDILEKNIVMKEISESYDFEEISSFYKASLLDIYNKNRFNDEWKKIYEFGKVLMKNKQ